jgi:hypothetical protein
LETKFELRRLPKACVAEELQGKKKRFSFFVPKPILCTLRDIFYDLEKIDSFFVFFPFLFVFTQQLSKQQQKTEIGQVPVVDRKSG